MEAPICRVCLKSDVLCSACQEKLESGTISEGDVEVSRFLYTLEDKFKSLQDAKLVKVVEGDSIILVAERGHAARIVGKQGSIVKVLAKHFNKSIKVIELSKDVKEFVRNLIPNASVNILYTTDGERYKIITKEQRVKLREVESVIRSMFKRPVEIVSVR